MRPDRSARHGTRRRALVVAMSLSLVAGAALAGAVAEPTPSPAAAAGTIGAGGEYHPVTPEPLDKRRMSVSTRTDVDTLALAGVPDDPSQVLALALSITVSGGDVDGELVAFSSDLPSAPPTSSLTFSKRRPTSALVVVRPGADGRVSFLLRPRDATSGSAVVDVSVVGWFSTSSAPVTGSRIVTRPMRVAYVGRLGPDATAVVAIRGKAGVPNSTAVEAAVLSITTLNGTATTSVSVGTDRNEASDTIAPTLVAKPKDISSTLAVVPLDAGGNVTVHNRSGNVDVVVHVVGYTRLGVDPASVTGRLVPLTRPYRAVDTTWSPSRPLGPGQAEPWSFAAYLADLTYTSTGQKVGPVAAVIGAFAAHSHRRQYALDPADVTQLRVYPDGAALPPSTNLLVGEDQRRSTTVLAGLSSSDALRVYNQAGTVHYRMDLAAVVLG